MTGRDEDRLVEHLYDELSPEEESAFSRLLAEDRAALDEVESLQATLSSLRAGLPAEEPSPHLDAKIFAYAREAAERHQAEGGGVIGKLRRLLRGPAVGIFAAATAAAIGVFVFLPQLQEPSYDAAQVVEEAPKAVGFASAPPAAVEPAPSSELQAQPRQASPEPPAEVAFGDLAEDVAKERTVSDGREPSTDNKRTAGKLAKQLDGFERRPAGGSGLGSDDGDRGGASRGQAQNKVVARFDAPEDPTIAEPAKPSPRKNAVAKLEAEADDEATRDSIVAEKDVQRSTRPADELAEGGLAQGAPAAVPVTPAPSPAPPREEAKADRGERAAASVARAKAQVAEKKSGEAATNGRAAPSPARLALTEAILKARSGEARVADQLAQRAVVLAGGTVEQAQITLEAAELFLSTGNYVLAERYALEAERGLQLAARSRARNVAEKAKAKRSAEADAPAAASEDAVR